MKDVQNAIYSIVETRGKECYCILCHAIDIAVEHQPNMPQMQFICNEVCKRTQKTDSCCCFQSAEPCDKGYLAKRKPRYAAPLLDWWSTNRERTDLFDFGKALGWPTKRSITLLSATVCFDIVCFTPPHVTCSKSFHRRCPVQSTRQASVTISVCPDWGQIPDCHSGKAHYRSIRFCGLTIPFNNWTGSNRYVFVCVSQQ